VKEEEEEKDKPILSQKSCANNFGFIFHPV